MKVMKYYKKGKVSEADEIQNGKGTGIANEVRPEVQQKLSTLNSQLSELINQRLQRKNQYLQDLKNIDNKIVMIQKQIADLGGSVNPSLIDESKSDRFSKALFESVTNRTDEMYAMLKMSFDDANLSYTPSDVRLKKFAKNIVAFINKSVFKESEDKEEMLDEYINGMLVNSHVSLSNNERGTFVKKFMESLGTNMVFKWIFEK